MEIIALENVNRRVSQYVSDTYIHIQCNFIDYIL